MKPSSAWRECGPEGKAVKLVLETLGELKRTALSQTLGKAAEKKNAREKRL